MKKWEPINIKAIGAYLMMKDYCAFIDKLIKEGCPDVNYLKEIRKERGYYLENLRVERDKALKFLEKEKERNLLNKITKLDDLMFFSKLKPNRPKIAKKLKELDEGIKKAENELKFLKETLKERHAYFKVYGKNRAISQRKLINDLVKLAKRKRLLAKKNKIPKEKREAQKIIKSLKLK